MISPRLLTVALLLPVGAFAQWIDYPDPSIPRLKNGKANLSAPVPKAANGKPDAKSDGDSKPKSEPAKTETKSETKSEPAKSSSTDK